MASDAMAGLAGIFGKDKGGKTPPPASEPDGDEPMGTKDASSGDEPSEAFKQALSETGLGLDDEQSAAFWRAIKECAGSY